MWAITVEETISASHRLPEGVFSRKCTFQHGHNFLIRVTIRGSTLNEYGMLVDFGAVREAIRGYDHTDLNAALQATSKEGESLLSPTAEVLAERIYWDVTGSLHLHGGVGAEVESVEVVETEGSLCKFIPDA